MALSIAKPLKPAVGLPLAQEGIKNQRRVSKMTENQFPHEIQTQEKKASKFPRWLLIVIPLVIIGIIYAILVKVFNFGFYSGTYTYDKAVMSAGLKNGQPVDFRNKFRPSDTIICTVKTTGLDGIIGMKWYFGEFLLHEKLGKTIDNTISTAIQSNKATILPEGKYHVDIYMGEDKIDTVYFEIELYHPVVNPEILIPDGHKNIETPWYTEVPFSFDEIWEVGDDKWKVNEVKIVLMNETDIFVAVVIDTDMEINSSYENELKAIAMPIAQYALENGYVSKAQSLQIDGKQYPLDKYVFVIFWNDEKQQVSRLQIPMDELE